MSKSKAFRLAAIAAVIAGPLTAAMATNGMNMEGYGPISSGMGGASQAIDNGNAAMAQNPATLSLMQAGSRLDVAVGFLGPKVSSAAGPMVADSGGTSYMMPAVGFTRRDGAMTYGVGMFAQGGMGTEYGANSFMGGPGAARSELGVGKIILPLSYQVNSNLAVGGAIDLMWAGLDVMMNMPTAQALGMMSNPKGAFASPQMMGALQASNYLRLDFSDGDKNSGAAKATGYSAKLGAVYKVSSTMTIGGSYQFKSSLNDMKTAVGSARMSSDAVVDAQGNRFSDAGTLTVMNFQWPSITSIGASWQTSPSVTVAADLKSIGWADVMKNFSMRYEASGGMGSADLTLPQNWKDQTVVSLGVAFKANDALTLRAGVNLANNPIPDATVNPLFPATVKDHVTAGLGYRVSKNGDFNMSLAHAPKGTVTSGQGVAISHEQTNWQFMYTHRY